MFIFSLGTAYYSREAGSTGKGEDYFNGPSKDAKKVNRRCVSLNGLSFITFSLERIFTFSPYVKLRKRNRKNNYNSFYINLFSHIWKKLQG